MGWDGNHPQMVGLWHWLCYMNVYAVPLDTVWYMMNSLHFYIIYTVIIQLVGGFSPSEKYEFVRLDHHPNSWGSHKFMFQTTNQLYNIHICHILRRSCPHVPAVPAAPASMSFIICSILASAFLLSASWLSCKRRQRDPMDGGNLQETTLWLCQNGHRNSEFSHEKLWLSSSLCERLPEGNSYGKLPLLIGKSSISMGRGFDMLNYQRVSLGYLGWWKENNTGQTWSFQPTIWVSCKILQDFEQFPFFQ